MDTTRQTGSTRRLEPFPMISVVLVHIMAGWAVWHWCTTGFATAAWVMLGLRWIVTGVGLSDGYHRLMTHQAFACSPWLQKVLYACGAIAIEREGGAGGENGNEGWGPTHAQHHAFADKEGDPHTPNEFGGGIRGFLWAHMGWMLFEKTPPPLGYRVPERFLKDPAIVWQKKYYWHFAIGGGFILVFLVTGWTGGSLAAGWYGMLLAGFFGLPFFWHVTGMTNSFCHTFGAPAVDASGQVLPTKRARNFPLWCLGNTMAILSWGEFWHANHHAHQHSAYLGWKWWEFDPGKWFIQLALKLGLVWDVVLP